MCLRSMRTIASLAGTPKVPARTAPDLLTIHANIQTWTAVLILTSWSLKAPSCAASMAGKPAVLPTWLAVRLSSASTRSTPTAGCSTCAELTLVTGDYVTFCWNT